MYIRMYVYIHIYACIYMYVSVCMYVCVYICMYENNNSYHFIFVDNVYAMSPVLAEDSVLLTLPFGGAVLQKLG